MTYGQSSQVTKFLDGETCLRLWLELDTLERVSGHLASQNIASNRTGKRPSRQGIAHAADRWAVKNPEKAWETYMRDFFVSRGVPTTFDEWMSNTVKHKAEKNLSPTGYDKFIALWFPGNTG